MQKFLIVIYGPTGVGKSNLAEKLADIVSGEIVNADVGQFYTPLSIGTAKPDWKNFHIKSHLFDILDRPKNLTVFEYREKVVRTASQIWKKNKIPIVVGGSTFYLLSLFFPPKNFELAKQKGDASLYREDIWEQLFEIDSNRAQELHKNDQYRIKRALDIWFTLGMKPSEIKPTYSPVAPYLFFNIEMARDVLYKGIDSRTIEMLKDGWVDEVRRLDLNVWKDFLHKKGLIGYPDILSYLELETALNYDKLVKDIQKKTRNYAKRQICFGKMMIRKLKTAQEEYKLQLGNDKSECFVEKVDKAFFHSSFDRIMRKVFLFSKEIVKLDE